MQDLERDRQIERLVARQVDGGGRAAAELAHQAVAQRLDPVGRDQRLRRRPGRAARRSGEGAAGRGAQVRARLRRRRCRRPGAAPSARRPPATAPSASSSSASARSTSRQSPSVSARAVASSGASSAARRGRALARRRSAGARSRSRAALVVGVLARGDGAARARRRSDRPPARRGRPRPAGDRSALRSSLDLEPARRCPATSMTSPCRRSQPGPMKWPSTRTATSGAPLQPDAVARNVRRPGRRCPGSSGSSGTGASPDQRAQAAVEPARSLRAARRRAPAVEPQQVVRARARSRPRRAGAARAGLERARPRGGRRRASRRPR